MQPSKAQGSSICVSEKRVSQWEELMRKFSRAHEEECQQTLADMPRAHRATKYFPTRSTYLGTWNVLGMSGFGIYTFPNGVVYEGNFDDGMFQGVGKLRYPDGTVLSGTFDKGTMVERKLMFADGLVYEEENWGYCKKPDRRYTREYNDGLQPAGIPNVTAELPPREIPPGFYDTGDGFYDPQSKCVYEAHDLSVMIRSPAVPEQNWIIQNCRYAPERVLGPRPDLYEKWPAPQDKLPEVPPPAADTRESLLEKKKSEKEQAFTRRRRSDWETQMSHKTSMSHIFEEYPGKMLKVFINSDVKLPTIESGDYILSTSQSVDAVSTTGTLKSCGTYQDLGLSLTNVYRKYDMVSGKLSLASTIIDQ